MSDTLEPHLVKAPVAPVASQFLHSCYNDRLSDNTDVVVVSELQHFADGRVEPHLKFMPKPKRSFWITKPQFRDHDEKRELEEVEKLDQFTVFNYELEREVFRQLNGYYTNQNYIDLKALCASPYLYGADVHIETLVKASSKKAFDLAVAKSAKEAEAAQKEGRDIGKISPAPATTGFFDIERSMLHGNAGEITVISLTHEENVYTAILDHAFFTFDAQGQRRTATLDELKAMSQSIITPLIDTALTTKKGLKRHRGRTFKFHYHIGQSEIELIQWIFAQLWKNKTSLVGIWNLAYDIQAILAAIKAAKLAPEDIFCPPDVPKQYRKVTYVHDNKQYPHFTDKWHWLYTTGYSQFFDYMALYAKLRTVAGKDTSYKLNDVLEKNGLGGKLHFEDLPDLAHLSEADWHRRMQSRHPLHYIVYNQWDVISLQLQEWQNNDAQSMLQLSEYTTLAKYPKQTRKVSDTLYVDWRDKGRITGTVSNDMKSPYDSEIGKTGGAVLSPLKLDYNGLNALTEAPHHKTQCHPFVNDVDFSGMYPSVGQAGNVSKGTKLSTVLYITGDAVQRYHTPKAAVETFFGYVVNPADNAIALGTEFFGLPDFDQMLALYEAKQLQLAV